MKTLNPQEKTYTIVLNKEKYEKRVAEIENEITNKNYEKAKEMLLEIAKYNKVEYVKIATMYYEARKTNESEKWFKIAYDKGLKDSIYYMGVIEFEEGNIEKGNEMVRRLKTTKGLKYYTLEYKTFVHEYK